MNSPHRADNSPDAGQARPLMGTMYNRVFWLAYSANTMLMVAVSLLFRYADFVTFHGGTPLNLGLIVGVGMVGALAMRGFLGTAIDHYGARRVWLASLVAVMTSLLLHLTLTSVHTPTVYLLRILLMVGLAGAFGASLTFMSLRAPAGRMGEMVGTLGSSGFIGIATGPVLGDWLFSNGQVTGFHVQRMFLLSAAAVVLSLVCTLLATHGSRRPRAKKRPSLIALLLRYHPGPMLLVAAAMGIGVMLPHTFLRAYTAYLDIPRIRTFFLVYAATAFAVRIATRRFTDRLGVRPVVLLGLSFMAASMLSYILVQHELMLALPAALGGIAHAFLFPAVVTGGSMTFPARYRGLATTLVLGMFDISNLVGQPAIGAVVEYAPRFGWPPYATMFTCVALAMTVSAVAYWLLSRPRRTPQQNVELSKEGRADRGEHELVQSAADT